MTIWAAPGVKCVKFRTWTPPEFRHIRFRPPAIVFPINKPVVISYVGINEPTGVMSLHFAEYPNLGSDGIDAGWYVGNFRPLITRTQSEDVALFTRILDGLPIEEPV